MTIEDEIFDFSEQIFGDEPTKAQRSDVLSDPTPFKNEDKPSKESPISYDTEVQTSYLLVNALLNLLIRKQVIYPHEVQALVEELHADYVKKKKGRDNDGAT
jgi:hypothetical protein